MLGPIGKSAVEGWVAAGRMAAARDLFARISQIEHVSSIYACIADPDQAACLKSDGAALLNFRERSFHFGDRLTRFISEDNHHVLAYFGAASAPLLGTQMLEEAIDRVRNACEPLAIVNNYHSTDWAIFNNANVVVKLADRLPIDNSLGWVLNHDAGFEVQALPPSAATRVDIDTPTDLLMIYKHPELGPYLKRFLAQAPKNALDRVHELLQVLTTPAAKLTIIGRASADLWQQLERKTQLWIRLFVEERGMVASLRLANGRVHSILGEIVDAWGPEKFVRKLATMSDAAVWDTRVWMAHHAEWPSAADRYAADLGLIDDIQNPDLKTLADAIGKASIPILAGGHGVVSGGFYAMLETISQN